VISNTLPDHNVDVLVVGAGNAALVAALSAHEAGARVLVLEAAPCDERGGNSRFSGGIFRIAHGGIDDLAPLLTEQSRSWLDRVKVVGYDRARYLADLARATAGQYDPELADVLVDQSLDTVGWMADQGVRWELTVGKLIDPDKMEPGRRYALPAGGELRAEHEGVGLVQNLFDAVERAGIEVLYDAPAQDLITAGDRVLGVRVRRPDREVEIHADAVVLACGGFESSPEMRLRYLGHGWDMVKVRGTRFNSGHMLGRAVGAGAQAAGNWGGAHAVPIDAEAPDVGDLRITDKMSRYSYPYAILVNRDGHRFVDEGSDEVWLTYAKTGWAIREQPQGVAFQIFDQKTLNLLEPRYATGNPVQAPTLAELAQKLGIDPAGLERTVAAFNDATRPGAFDPFAKDGLATEGITPPKSNWAQPIEDPPFVAYAVTCGITFTFGGLKIDTEGRVRTQQGRPMPGLYATGEIAGGFFAHNYPAGAGLTRGAVFGRICGVNAAAHVERGVAATR
jgi:tricarballylate dehydrogenase